MVPGHAIQALPGADGAALVPTELALLPGHSSNASRWRLSSGGLALIVALGLAYGGFLLLPGIHSNSNSSSEDARSSEGAIVGYAPKPSMVESSIRAHSGKTVPSIAAKAAVTPPVPQVRDVADSLRVVQLHLDSNDLGGARAMLDAVAAIQPGNADVSGLQRELASREARRDIAIQSARKCAKDKMWGCVKTSAHDALAIDTSSGEAQALLARAIVESGWAPLTPNKPQPRVPVEAGKSNAANADAQARAIVESGWKHPVDNSTKPPPDQASAR
jgi:hypothetical protein